MFKQGFEKVAYKQSPVIKLFDMLDYMKMRKELDKKEKKRKK